MVRTCTCIMHTTYNSTVHFSSPYNYKVYSDKMHIHTCRCPYTKISCLIRTAWDVRRHTRYKTSHFLVMKYDCGCSHCEGHVTHLVLSISLASEHCSLTMASNWAGSIGWADAASFSASTSTKWTLEYLYTRAQWLHINWWVWLALSTNLITLHV